MALTNVEMDLMVSNHKFSLLISVTPEPRLGSARAIFQKARIEKIGKNEPILTRNFDFQGPTFHEL